MISSEFPADMTEKELLDGEDHHQAAEQSRKLSMATGLTKSSDELRRAWEKDPELFLATLSGAVAAYRQNDLLEELLRGAITRLVSIVEDTESELVEAAMAIVLDSETGEVS